VGRARCGASPAAVEERRAIACRPKEHQDFAASRALFCPMVNEADRLRADIKHYRKMLLVVGDRAALQTLETMIVEKEKRLLAIADRRTTRASP
jgi:hypothetical protein